MKHIFPIFVALLSTTTLFAYDMKVNGIYYNYGRTGEVIVTFNQGTHYSGNVVIPSTINSGGRTFTVTGIGKSAFLNCTELTSITIPNTVTSIDDYAFIGCTSLPIVNNIRYAGNFLIEAVDKSLLTYEIKDGTIWIGPSAFYGCANLNTITIPNSVTRIAESAFRGCTSLTTIIISKSVAYIGEKAFADCSNLSAVISESESLIEFHRNAFQGCNKILYVTFNANSMCQFERVYEYFGSQVLKYNFGDSVTELGSSLFSNCKTLTSICLPKNVIKIGAGAFNSCSNLDSVYLGNSVAEIGGSAFFDCSVLRTIHIPESLRLIGMSAFGKCTALTSIDIPKSVSSIGDYAFYGVNNVNYQGPASGSPWEAKCINGYVEGMLVYSDSTKTKICGCSSLASGHVVIPNTVQIIGDNAFVGCKKITEITIGTGVQTIEENAFYECTNIWTVINLSNLPITRHSTEYGYVACYADKVLTGKMVDDFLVQNDTTLVAYFGDNIEVKIPDGITKIGKEAFRGNASLQSVIIGNTVKYIGDDAFVSCYELKSVDFGASVKSIGDFAFSGCEKLIEINIDKSVETIGNSAFTYCSSLKTIKTGELLNRIGNNAFYNCYKLENVILGINTKYIGQSAFYSCISISSITIPNSVIEIGESAFSNCNKLSSISIPNSVTTIYNKAFSGCTGLQSLIFGNSVKYIGAEAFKNCSNIRKIYSYAINPPSCGADAFSGLSQYAKAYVLASSLEDYQFSAGWRDLTLIPIGADEQSMNDDQLIVSPSDNSVTITWPLCENASTYTLIISKNGEEVCTLSFNAEGQLINIAFKAPSEMGVNNSPAALAITQGFRFTITNLNPGTTYAYQVIANSSVGSIIKDFSGNFTTNSISSIEEIIVHQFEKHKIIRNGVPLINFNGKTFTFFGSLIK